MGNSEVAKAEVEKLEEKLQEGVTFILKQSTNFKLLRVFLGILMIIFSATIGLGLTVVIFIGYFIVYFIIAVGPQSMEWALGAGSVAGLGAGLTFGAPIGFLLGIAICVIFFFFQFPNILTINPEGISWRRGYLYKALRFADIAKLEYFRTTFFAKCSIVLNDGKEIRIPINCWGVQSALPAATYVKIIFRYYLNSSQ